jgi:hypothetical protein
VEVAEPALLFPLHLGQLHAYETLLVLLVAFGPFVVIALLAVRERRRAAADSAGSHERESGEPPLS